MGKVHRRYRSEISFTDKVIKGSYGVNHCERMNNLTSVGELEGLSRSFSEVN